MIGEPSLVIHVSDVRIEIVCPDGTAASLRAVWDPASRPLIPVRRTTRWTACADRDGWTLTIDDVFVESGSAATSLALVIERELMTRLRGWHPDACILHAALIEVGGTWAILLGQSGAGKSSLTLAGVRAGGRYVSDELVVTDGARVWGVGRSVLFDVGPVTTPLPERMAQADRSSYRFRLPSGDEVAIPIMRVPPAQWATAPVDARSVVIVSLDGRGSDWVKPLSPAHGLAALLTASYTLEWRELGPLAREGQCFSLGWSDPARAIALLTEATSHLASDPVQSAP